MAGPRLTYVRSLIFNPPTVFPGSAGIVPCAPADDRYGPPVAPGGHPGGPGAARGSDGPVTGVGSYNRRTGRAMAPRRRPISREG